MSFTDGLIAGAEKTGYMNVSNLLTKGIDFTTTIANNADGIASYANAMSTHNTIMDARTRAGVIEQNMISGINNVSRRGLTGEEGVGFSKSALVLHDFGGAGEFDTMMGRNMYYQSGVSGNGVTKSGIGGAYSIMDSSMLTNSLMGAVTMSHESYRDGIKGLNNETETLQAVFAHTEMAKRLISQNGTGWLNGNLVMDLIAQDMGKETFSKYVGDMYSSESDFWKVKKDGSVEWDGSMAVTDESTGEVKQFNSYSEGLAAILGISKSEAQKMMNDKGARWDGAKWNVPEGIVFGKLNLPNQSNGWDKMKNFIGGFFGDKNTIAEIKIDDKKDIKIEIEGADSYLKPQTSYEIFGGTDLSQNFFCLATGIKNAVIQSIKDKSGSYPSEEKIIKALEDMSSMGYPKSGIAFNKETEVINNNTYTYNRGYTNPQIEANALYKLLTETKGNWIGIRNNNYEDFIDAYNKLKASNKNPYLIINFDTNYGFKHNSYSPSFDTKTQNFNYIDSWTGVLNERSIWNDTDTNNKYWEKVQGALTPKEIINYWLLYQE